jgi:hypothetical protein
LRHHSLDRTAFTARAVSRGLPASFGGDAGPAQYLADSLTAQVYILPLRQRLGELGVIMDGVNAAFQAQNRLALVCAQSICGTLSTPLVSQAGGPVKHVTLADAFALPVAYPSKWQPSARLIEPKTICSITLIRLSSFRLKIIAFPFSLLMERDIFTLQLMGTFSLC